MSSHPLPSADAAQAAAAAVAGRGIRHQMPLPERDPVRARIYGERAKAWTVAAGAALPRRHLRLRRPGRRRAMVARLLADTGAVVVSLAYPLAESPSPAPIEVGFAALEWLYKHRNKLAGKGARVYLAGEEAGGNLAAARGADRARPRPSAAGGPDPAVADARPLRRHASLREASDDVPSAVGRRMAGIPGRPKDATHPYAVPGARCGWPSWRPPWCWSARTMRCATRRCLSRAACARPASRCTAPCCPRATAPSVLTTQDATAVPLRGARVKGSTSALSSPARRRPPPA